MSYRKAVAKPCTSLLLSIQVYHPCQWENEALRTSPRCLPAEAQGEEDTALCFVAIFMQTVNLDSISQERASICSK